MEPEIFEKGTPSTLELTESRSLLARAVDVTYARPCGTLPHISPPHLSPTSLLSQSSFVSFLSQSTTVLGSLLHKENVRGRQPLVPQTATQSVLSEDGSLYRKMVAMAKYCKNKIYQSKSRTSRCTISKLCSRRYGLGYPQAGVHTLKTQRR